MARHRDTNREESPKAKVTKESIKEALVIFGYMRPYHSAFIAGLIFTGLSGGTTMVIPYLLNRLVDSANGTIKAGYFSNYLASPDTIALAMLAILVLQVLFSYLRIYLLSYVGENAVGDMRQDVYKRLITMPMDFFGQRRVGELSSRLTADASQILDAVTVMLPELLRGIVTLIISLIFILLISPQMTALMLAVVPVVIALALIFGKFIRKMSRKAQDQLADSNTVVQETLQGISNVKAFSNEWYEIARYRRNITDVVKLSIKNGRFRGLFVSFMLFSVFGAIVLVVWYGVNLMQNGDLSFGDLTAFVLYTSLLGVTMAGFANMFSQLQKTLGATQRVRELLKEDIESVSVANTQVQPENKLKGNVTMEHIQFSYPSRKDVTVIKDLSLQADTGQQIAIVGPSGAGKSTIVSLLLRFYDPNNGRLLFDGKNAADIPLSELRKQMALVPQDILLFGGTIYENIAYGNPDATEADIISAAKQANAHDFISRFPESYQTMVGERGVKLSGGQRQRIAIARAILKNPVILVLDEATSSLDSESEQQVQEALYNLMQNRTSFVIAHRLSTIRNADKILVLEDGMVKESGTHQELIGIPDGLYRSLNKLQMFEE